MLSEAWARVKLVLCGVSCAVPPSHGVPMPPLPAVPPPPCFCTRITVQKRDCSLTLTHTHVNTQQPPLGILAPNTMSSVIFQAPGT